MSVDQRYVRENIERVCARQEMRDGCQSHDLGAVIRILPACIGSGSRRGLMPMHAKLLADVIDIYTVLADPRIAPAHDSPAARELRAACGQPSQVGAWGEEPVRAAYGLAVMGYSVALDHARAMVALMSGELTAVPTVVLARALVEVAGQTWWLLEPEIGHINRICRLQILRYRSAVEGGKAAKADGAPADDYYGCTETTVQVEQYSRSLDLEVPEWSKKKRMYVCGGEELPSATALVRGIFDKVDVPSVYNLHSGYSHGQYFALLREFEQTMDGDNTRYRPTINEESFKGTVAVASYALYSLADRLSVLFGLGPVAPDSPYERTSA